MNAIFEFFFHSEPTTSATGEMTKLDWKKTLRMGLMLALGGAITAVADYVSAHLAGWEFGAYKPFIVPVITMALEALRRWATNNRVE